MAQDGRQAWSGPDDREAAVDLSLYLGSSGQSVDPVDHAVARRVSREESLSLGLLPFRRADGQLFVATLWPLRPGADAVLKRLAADSSVHLVRTSEIPLRHAQERVFSGAREGSLGSILIAQGKMGPEQLKRALDQQVRTGGRLGEILVSQNAITGFDLAQALAAQHSLPCIDLLQLVRDRGRGVHGQASLDFSLLDRLPASLWHAYQAVPVRVEDGVLLVAMVDPTDRSSLDAIERATGWSVRPLATGRRDIRAVLDAHFGAADLEDSCQRLASRRPDQSARQLVTRPQVVVGLSVLVACTVAAMVRPTPTVIAVSVLFEAFYLAVTAYRLVFMLRPAGSSLAVQVGVADLNALDGKDLPVYTVLVPAFREARVLPTLVRALTELDYPKDRLDVKLLLEHDDAETIKVARSMGLPNYIEIVEIPAGGPRTKPKACNYGLQRARGELLVIYDAEDIPEPLQLKKAVAAYKKVPEQVVALQCSVSFFNPGQNVLTSLFTAEYAAWFELMLPALHAARLPLPLGGNSTHFRTSALRQVDAWDPYNVAEDADLGIRLYRDGFRVAVIESTTYEEATTDFTNWVRQRSRWLKGYMQTWLVHMRHPFRLSRELGWRGLVAFQVVVGGTFLLALLNPVYWLLTTLWFVTKAPFIQTLFPPWIFYLAMGNFFFGSFVFTYLNLLAVAKRGDWALVKHSLVSPIYWSMISVGAWKAILQLVGGQAHYWEKTEHGRTAGAAPLAKPPADADSEVAAG